MKIEVSQITRIPTKYLEILKTQDVESVGKLFINILGGDEELTNNETIFFNLIMTDVNNINGQAEIGSKQGHYGSSGGRPKKEKVNMGGVDNQTPGGGEVKPQGKIKKDNIKEIDKEKYLSLFNIEELTKEEKSYIKTLWTMIRCGYEIQLDKKKIDEMMIWIKDLYKDYIPRREDGPVNTIIADKRTKDRFEYRSEEYKNKPKKKRNYKSSIRNSFKMYST